MFIQGNILGFAIFVAAGIFVAVGAYILKFPDWIVMISAGAFCLVTDLFIRALQSKQKGFLFAKNLGGYLFFAPVWIFGAAVIAINLITHLAKK